MTTNQDIIRYRINEIRSKVKGLEKQIQELEMNCAGNQEEALEEINGLIIGCDDLEEILDTDKELAEIRAALK